MKLITRPLQKLRNDAFYLVTGSALTIFAGTFYKFNQLQNKDTDTKFEREVTFRGESVDGNEVVLTNRTILEIKTAPASTSTETPPISSVNELDVNNIGIFKEGFNLLLENELFQFMFALATILSVVTCYFLYKKGFVDYLKRKFGYWYVLISYLVIQVVICLNVQFIWEFYDLIR